MCVVQLDFTNTVVNKGIEDIFPDNLSVIAAATAAEAGNSEPERTMTGEFGQPPRFTSSCVSCPSSAALFVPSSPAIQVTEPQSCSVVYSSGSSRDLPKALDTRLRQPSSAPPAPPSKHQPLSVPLTPHTTPIPPPPTSSGACFHEALRLIYERHNAVSILPAVAVAKPPPFPMHQSESGLCRLVEPMRRRRPNERMTFKSIHEQQHPNKSSFALTTILGEEVTSATSSASLLSASSVSNALTLHSPRRTSELDLLVVTEGDAHQFSDTMQAGSSLTSPPSTTFGGLTPQRTAHLSANPKSSVSFPTAQISIFTTIASAVAAATTADVIAPSAVYRVGLSSPIATSTSTPDLQAGFRRSEAAKCRRVYGAVNKSRWCKQCRWKKACTRFQGSSFIKKTPLNRL